jgi:hypothetical protein
MSHSRILSKALQLAVLGVAVYYALDWLDIPIRNHWAGEPWRFISHAFLALCIAGVVLQIAWGLLSTDGREDA